MTAFDAAWSLLKMPIVPGSLKETERGFAADFIDPVSDENLQMTVRGLPSPGAGLYAKIHDPLYDELGTGLERGFVNVTDAPISNHLTGETRTGPFWPVQAFTVPKYRKRGYGTAMYDLLAAILDRYGGYRLSPSNQRTDDAMRLWQGKSMDESWPVRDDL